jgi:hypothetical protein
MVSSPPLPPETATDDGLANLRMRRDHVLHLDGVDLVAGHLDEELHPARDEQPPLVVEPAEIAVAASLRTTMASAPFVSASNWKRLNVKES